MRRELFRFMWELEWRVCFSSNELTATKNRSFATIVQNERSRVVGYQHRSHWWLRFEGRSVG